MAHYGAALARTDGAWTAWEADLSGEGDLDTIADDLLDEGGEEAAGADVLLLLLEENDEWFAVIRWDSPGQGLADPKAYLSDGRVLEVSELARRLLADALPVATRIEDPDEDAGRPELEPSGDVGLLEDLGTTGDRLIELTAEEGMLPADTLAAIAEAAGAAEVFEELRGV